MAGGVDHLQGGPADGEHVPVGDPVLGCGAGVDLFPEDLVRGVQVDRCAHGFGDVAGGADVVVVGAGEQDRFDVPAGHGGDGRRGVVRGVDDHAFIVVAHDPDIVIHIPGAPVQGKRARGDQVLDPDAHTDATAVSAAAAWVPAADSISTTELISTTERRTLPS